MSNPILVKINRRIPVSCDRWTYRCRICDHTPWGGITWSGAGVAADAGRRHYSAYHGIPTTQ